MAGTVFYTFSPATLAKSSEVNANFDWLEGHLWPMAGGSTTSAVYDLGSSTAKWRDLYLSRSIQLGAGATLTAANIQPVDDSTLAITGTSMVIKAGGVGTTQLTNGAVTNAKVNDVDASKITGTLGVAHIQQGPGSTLNADLLDSYDSATLIALAIVM